MNKKETELSLRNEFACAIAENDLENVKSLIQKHGAETFYYYETGGMTLLYASTMYEDLPLLKVLCENGWRLDEVDYNQKNAFYGAINAYDDEILLYVVDSGININHRCKLGKSVIMDALDESQFDRAFILYEKGIDMNIRDNRGRDVFDYMNEVPRDVLKIWVERFLEEPERFDEILIKKIKAKKLRLLLI